MSSSPPTSLLRGFPAAQSLSPADQLRLEQGLERRVFQPEDVLFRQGDAAEELYLVLRGRLEISATVGGRRVLLGEVGPGEVLGEMGVLDDAPRSATATATDRVEALALSRAQYGRLAVRGEPLAHWFLSLVSRGVARRVRDLTMRIAEARADPDLLHHLPQHPEERAHSWWQFLFRRGDP